MLFLFLVLQVGLPLLLLLWLWLAPLRSRWGIAMQIATTGLFLALLGLVGVWALLPYWICFLYALLFGGLAFRTIGRDQPVRPRGLGWAAFAFFGLLAVLFLILIALVLIGRTPPGPTVDIRSPLRGGGYLVVNGGNAIAANGHLMTLGSNRRFDPWRGQSYGLDIVKLNRLGRNSGGVAPSDPARYEIFGEPLHSPCDGKVVAARNDMPDMPVPQMDRSFLAGNFVSIRCGRFEVVLGHFRQGSLQVAAGDAVQTGDILGEAGNSGNSSEPHLHIHAQTPGTPEQPLSGRPLPLSIDGRYLVRNDRF
jgi:hypothetical protein